MGKYATVRAFALAVIVFAASAWPSTSTATNVQFVGGVAYDYVGNVVTLTADRVENFTAGVTSGTLRMEWWAFESPYDGSAQTGYKLAQYSLGQLQSGFAFININSGGLAFTLPPTGSWALVMVLTEFDGGPVNNGYSVRDWVNFINPLVVNAPLATAVAVEYYHALFDHYFVTAIIDEIVKLDDGVFAGWTRTGQTFKVYVASSSSRSNVCRFFSSSFGAKSSHFYTPDAAECSIVQANPNWVFEAVVFYMIRPNSVGNCAAGTLPVYRMYNNGQGAAPNHRYTTSLGVRNTMLGRGWIPEGYGPIDVTCARRRRRASRRVAARIGWLGR